MVRDVDVAPHLLDLDLAAKAEDGFELVVLGDASNAGHVRSGEHGTSLAGVVTRQINLGRGRRAKRRAP